jgi:hypothetical protein
MLSDAGIELIFSFGHSIVWLFVFFCRLIHLTVSLKFRTMTFTNYLSIAYFCDSCLINDKLSDHLCYKPVRLSVIFEKCVKMVTRMNTSAPLMESLNIMAEGLMKIIVMLRNLS